MDDETGSEPVLFTGAIKSKKDNRDYQIKNIGGVSPYDWSTPYDAEADGVLQTKDQGSSYSCGGQAAGYYAQKLNSSPELSASFIYKPIAYPGGGSTGRDICDRLIKLGDCLETLCPSPKDEASMLATAISAEAVKDALTRKVDTYAQVPIDIDSVATAIKNFKGVILGVAGRNNGTWFTTYPKTTGTNPIWYHWVWACKTKTENGVKFIGFRNSWGNIGDNGVQWISEDFFPNYIFEVWSVIKNAKYIFKSSMWVGQRSADVHALQVRLNMPEKYQTGFYGQLTRAAVLKYQLDNKIITSGSESVWGYYCGPKTIKYLNAIASM